MDAGMKRVEESYRSLGDGMEKLKEDAAGLKERITAVGDAMASKMGDLQRTADDIGSVANRSLENQARLLDGQEKAIEGLHDLHSFAEEALEKSTGNDVFCCRLMIRGLND